MEIDMRESRISSARSTLAKASVVACLAVMTAAPAWAADSGSASEGRGFAGLLEMFNIFASHHDAKAPPAAAPGDKAPDGARVRLSSNGAGSTKLGIEIPLDDPGSGGKGKGAFIYLESGTDIVDPADLDRQLPKTIGEASPGSPTDAWRRGRARPSADGRSRARCRTACRRGRSGPSRRATPRSISAFPICRRSRRTRITRGSNSASPRRSCAGTALTGSIACLSTRRCSARTARYTISALISAIPASPSAPRCSATAPTLWARRRPMTSG